MEENNRLNFDKENTEIFAKNTIAYSIDDKYLKYSWNKSDNNFDFISEDGLSVLEVTLVITKNTENVLKYESEIYDHPNINKTKYKKEIKGAKFDNNDLIFYYGGSMEEIRNLVINRIIKKNQKALNKRKVSINCYELCILVDDCGLFDSIYSFNFLKDNHVIDSTLFSKIYIITSNKFFIYEKNDIQEVKRIIKQLI